MLLKDEDFWLACDGELVLIFQADTMLCRGAELGLEAFCEYDYVGAPFQPGECPPGHDKDRSMCQDDFDKMARHANLSVPAYGVGGNGGLSLRRRSKMLEMVRVCASAHPFRTWNEDIFFSFPCDDIAVHLPPEHLARKFSVETGRFHARPFGIHKVWAYKSDEELAQVSAGQSGSMHGRQLGKEARVRWSLCQAVWHASVEALTRSQASRPLYCPRHACPLT